MPNNTGEFLKLRRKIMERDFSRMNDMQREAVFCTEGPLLILAGAGSGKTTVLINRIANMVKYGKAYESTQTPDVISDDDMALLNAAAAGKASPEQLSRVVSLCAVDPCPAWRLLAITFTNKAAGELKERLSRMLGQDSGEIQASTFHSFCARILRRDGDQLGYSNHFTIYDTDDSIRLMKDCMKSLNIADKTLGHKAILSEIGRAKDKMLAPDEYLASAQGDYRKKLIAAAYSKYQGRLKEADAMDFDDLLFQTVILFRKAPGVLERYQKRFRYIMVDEYQDTNHSQYEFVSMLAELSGNLCVVGDDDQSIYKFRGATIENILGFEKRYKGCRVIRLEQNYRSTQNILDAANAVISKNQNRKGKTLWTDNPKGEKLEVHSLDNEDEESRFIADTIQDGVAGGKGYGDFAVLYRMNAQANAIERALVKSGIPYRIIGGHRFYDTKEVRDAMAYLKVINNTNDSVALRRIINEPKRGIGDTTLDKAAQVADALGISLYEVISNADNYADLSRAAVKLKGFANMIEGLREKNADPESSIHQLYTDMLEATGYLAMWEQAGETEVGRVENLNELASSIINYEENSPDEIPELAGFLEEAALMTDFDNYDAGADTVVLMTMHAAKGLEFPVVFLPGFEDGVFPGMQTLFNPDDMDEERRLCYVAITRAKENLYILNAASRMLYGSTTRNRPSCFLSDIPQENIERHDSTFSSYNLYQAQSPAYEYKQSFPKSFNRRDIAGGGISGSTSQVRFDSGKKGYEKSSASSIVWKSGDMVSHKVFGKGEILSVNPMGNDTLLEIRFEQVGLKKIMANFVRLTKADK
ncbi:MAG: 3'-5' exonuclease [Oscillospiraceae bacterium]|nr:3'-5' exonuclease [Oscillospiraceae bacterium]MDD4546683.1 3'-5' exonuclease [Oscillospiraceae bacterium]